MCGVVATQNRASLRALERAGHAIVGEVTRISFGLGVLIWHTPWHRIEYALRSRDIEAGAHWRSPASGTAQALALGTASTATTDFLRQSPLGLPQSPLAQGKP